MKKIILLVITTLFAISAQADLNIYTDRSASLMDPVVDRFVQETGEPVNYIRISGSQMIDRLLAGGEGPPADVVIVKDMLYLNEMSELGLFQPMSVSTDAIPQQMQHPEKEWASITMRARTIVYNKSLVQPEEVSTYAALGDEKWKGKLCVRTSNSSYNVSLIAGFVADYGYDDAKGLMQSWINNLAGSPEGNDRAVLAKVESGDCHVGIVNSYYLGQENNLGKNLNVGIVFADQDGLGAHVNGTGVGILATTEKIDLANKFAEIAISSESQYVFANAHYDYPVSSDLVPQTLIVDWGTFFANQTNWSVIGLHKNAAFSIIQEIGYE